MSKRKTERIKKRLSCELHAGGRRYTGIVLDLSLGGVFVQTSARLKPGAAVRVVLRPDGHEDGIEARALVARTKLVPPQLRSMAGGGIGLRIADPPEDYLRFVEASRPADSVREPSLRTGAARR